MARSSTYSGSIPQALATITGDPLSDEALEMGIVGTAIACRDHSLFIMWADEDGQHEKELSQAEYDRVVEQTAPLNRTRLQCVLLDIIKQERKRLDKR